MSLLDGHPQLVAVSEETDYYPVMRSSPYVSAEDFSNRLMKNTHLKNLSKGKTDDYIGGNFNYANFDSDLFVAQLIKNLSRFVDPTRGGEALQAIVDAYYEVSSAQIQYTTPKYWLEKTPRHTYYVRSILEDFPEAKFIFSVRDPRDNYLSYKKKHRHLTMERFANMWSQSMSMYNELHQVYGQSKVTIVRYEDLVTTPSEEISKLSDYLQIERDPKLFKPSKFGIPWKGNSMFDQSFDEISTSTLGRYKSAKSTDELRCLELILKESMIGVGYENYFLKGSNFSLSVWQKLKLWLDKVKNRKLEYIESLS